ncbi:MAG: two-component system response regulator OmpR [Proteobacteria bacterium]|nr:two-component system response regulator OmpR [Pseudomonadota bacterium]
MGTEAMPRILLVDDDLRLRALLETYLKREGFEVALAGNARQMDTMLREQPVDLMVLDLMLPDRGGLDICRDLRGSGNTLPVVMLTAKGDDIDRILGLEIGADDYLAKPCNPRELVARIRAVMRRHQTRPPGAPASEGAVVAFGPFRLHPGTRVLERDGAPVPLTTGEFAMLYALASHPGETLSRERLLALAKGRQRGAFDRSIDIQISRLRRIVEADPAHPRYLQTVWGAGYVFVPDPPA